MMSKSCIAILFVVLFSIPAVVFSDPSETESLSAEDALTEYLQSEKAAKLKCIRKLDAARSEALADKNREKAQEIFETNPDVTRKLRAMWALHVTGGLTEKSLRSMLAGCSCAQSE